MQSAQEFINIDVVYMQYSSERDSCMPDVRFDGSRLVGLADLHDQRMRQRSKRRLTDPLIYKHRNWYSSVMLEELYNAPTGYQLQVFHWSIESGVRQAFQLDDGRSLDAVSMIFGPAMEYWFGVNPESQSGSRTIHLCLPRSVPIAPCDQFWQILPRCPRVLVACNSCSLFFWRGSTSSTPIVCNKPAGNGAMYEDGSNEDVLFFKISMCKFRRSSMQMYDPVKSEKIRMHVRQLKPKLSTIVECN